MHHTSSHRLAFNFDLTEVEPALQLTMGSSVSRQEIKDRFSSLLDISVSNSCHITQTSLNRMRFCGLELDADSCTVTFRQDMKGSVAYCTSKISANAVTKMMADAVQKANQNQTFGNVNLSKDKITTEMAQKVVENISNSCDMKSDSENCMSFKNTKIRCNGGSINWDQAIGTSFASCQMDSAASALADAYAKDIQSTKQGGMTWLWVVLGIAGALILIVILYKVITGAGGGGGSGGSKQPVIINTGSASETSNSPRYPERERTTTAPASGASEASSTDAGAGVSGGWLGQRRGRGRGQVRGRGRRDGMVERGRSHMPPRPRQEFSRTATTMVAAPSSSSAASSPSMERHQSDNGMRVVGGDDGARVRGGSNEAHQALLRAVNPFS